MCISSLYIVHRRDSFVIGTAPALIKLDKGGFLIGDRFYYIDNTANVSITFVIFNVNFWGL